MIHQRSGLTSSPLLSVVDSARRTRTPAGTSMTSALARCFSDSDSSACSRESKDCPLSNDFLVVLSNA